MLKDSTITIKRTIRGSDIDIYTRYIKINIKIA